MSVGDTIECSSIGELIDTHEALVADGWDVEFEYEQGKKAVLVLKGRIEE